MSSIFFSPVLNGLEGAKEIRKRLPTFSVCFSGRVMCGFVENTIRNSHERPESRGPRPFADCRVKLPNVQRHGDGNMFVDTEW